MPHRAGRARAQRRGGGPTPQAPQQTGSQYRARSPHTHTPATTHPAAHKAPVWRCRASTAAARQRRNMAEGAQSRAGRRRGPRLAPRRTGPGARVPAPEARGALAARRPGLPASPRRAPLGPASPGIYSPAALTPPPPVYYAGRAS